MKDEVRDRLATFTDSDASLQTRLKQMYHVPVLLVLIGFMIAVRLRRLDSFTRDGEIYFAGNDPWYHFRETSYLLENFPSTMPFDVMTNYPTGTSAGQFGTLYDQIVAGVILLTSLGEPSQGYASMVMLIAAPVFVSATVLPIYFIATRFTGRNPALVGVAVFALLPGTILAPYTFVGFYDHPAAEVLFQTLGVAAFVGALTVAEREQPVWELVVDRDIDALRRPLLYSVGAGIAATLYMWAWPPGVLLVGFTGIFFALKLTSEVYHGRSPEPIAFVGGVSMTVTGLLMLLPLRYLDFGSATEFSALQVVLSLGVAAGCVFLAWLARQWEARELDESRYPVAVGGILLALAILFRDFSQNLISSVLNRIGFSTGAQGRTVGEIQPFLASGGNFDVIYSEYRLTFFTALLAVLVILARPLITSDDTRETEYVAAALGTVGILLLATPFAKSVAGLLGMTWEVLGIIIVSGFLIGATLLNRYDSPELYLVVWAGFITSAAFTQTRFNYYLAVVVAVFTALFVAQVASYIDLRETADSISESTRQLEGWQTIVAVTLVFALIGPFVVWSGPTLAAWQTGGQNGPGQSIQIWDDSLEWMNNNTPAPGTLGNGNQSKAIDTRGTYGRPPDGDYDYLEGSYGVQSWWDYGHWITVLGDRIPNANPFQQGATEAANYLLAQNETLANAALEAQMGEEDEGQTRYVMIDAQMVSPRSKFVMPTWKNNVTSRDFYVRALPINSNRQVGRPQILRKQSYYQSQMLRLYIAHGSAMNPRPIAFNTQQGEVRTQSGGTVERTVFRQQDGVKTFNTTDEAKRFVEENPNFELYGIGSKPPRQVDALEHYRLVHASSQRTRVLGPRYRYGSFVKTFEKVPGATIKGTAPPRSTVRAVVQMKIPSTGQTFPYIQYATADANGDFNMTVPYSTTGYENFGPENGYTNVSVRAVSDYRFRTTGDTGSLFTGSAAVTEAQVLGVNDDPVRVGLSETQPIQVGQQGIQAAG